MNPLRVQPVITLDAALELVRLAVDEGARRGVPVSASVVDPSLNLVAFGRSDGATPHSIETSRRKANTAASKRRATGWMGPRLGLTLPLAAGNQLTDVIGGVPVVYAGELGGGLGIAGGTEDDDIAVAVAVLKAAGADPVDSVEGR